MTSSIAELMVGPLGVGPLGVVLLGSGTGGLVLPAMIESAIVHPGLVVGQMMKWAPTWLTPIWILSVGLGLGALVSAGVYLLLAILSFLPGIGNLPDNPNRGVTVSLCFGALFSAVLCYLYIPRESDYSELLFLPVICVGLVLGFGLIYGAWHRTRSEWPAILTEGVVPYLLAVAGAFGLIGAASTPLVTNPMTTIDSIRAVNLIGDGTERLQVNLPAISAEIDPDEATFHPAGIQYNLRNVAELTIESDRTILIADSAKPAGFSRAPFRVNAGEKLTYRYEDRDAAPVPGDWTRLHIQNREIDPATVVFTFKNLPQVPQAATIVGVAVFFFLSLTGLLVFRQAAPRVWALALSTAKNEMAQPLYLLLLTFGVFLIVVFEFLPFNTFGDDIRFLRDCGVTVIMILGMIQAVWSAGTSVSEEIEGRTALTVLSKPVSRRSFILGKYAGIMLAVLVLFAVIAAVLLIAISYKPIFDARESTRGVTTWQTGLEEVMTTIPLLGLYFMQTMAIGAIAVALATRLSLLPNFITCFVVFLIGNLTSPLVASTEGKNELVGFVGKLIAVVVPNLNVFNVQSAVDAGNPIPVIYLAGSFNYLVCFVIAVWMLAMLLFEDRDLA